MPRKKTQEEFEKEVLEKTNNEYMVLGKYINNRTKIKFKHIKCGTVFETTPKDFIDGKSRCPEQGKINMKMAQRKSSQKFEEEFETLVNGEYSLLSKYINTRTKIKVRHNFCGYEYMVNPNNFLTKGVKCPKCAKNQKKTTEEFRKEVYQLENDEYKVIGKYKGKNIKILFYHNECGRYFEMTPDKFIQGHRCTQCSESKGEAKVRKILTKNKLEFATQYRFNDCRGEKYPLPFDFAIFNNKKLYCLIEFDGEQHFKPINFNGIDSERANELYYKTVKRDKIKNDYCKENQIKLIRIPYWEKDIEKIILNMGIPSQADCESSGSV